VAGGDDFASSVRGFVPRGYSFRGFPICFNHISPARMLETLLSTPAARDILEVREALHCTLARVWTCGPAGVTRVGGVLPADVRSRSRRRLAVTERLSLTCVALLPYLQAPSDSETIFALKARVHVFPEDTTAAWVMLAVCQPVMEVFAGSGRH
jgi:hypothetical protein